MIRRPPRSTQSRSSAASDVYKRQGSGDRIFPEPSVEEGLAGIILVSAGPLEAAMSSESLVAHSGVNRRQTTQLIPQLLCGRVAPVVSEACSKVGDDDEVILRLTRRVKGFAHELDATFRRREGAVCLCPTCRCGQNDVG